MKKMMTSADVRETFLKFFESKGCHREKSSSLVPLNDPTLLFTSAGMVQFKDVFTGIEKRAYTRATTAQKCLRAGGKHNDLDNVGFTARHHTFFEMLGNFSFGDYFKKEAIAWAWELVTEKFGLPKERLHVTVFREDDEAYDLWHKMIGVPKERIYRFDEKDNFWAAGDVGPCGPCTEIYFDRGEKYNTGNPEMDKMGGDGDRFLEFYNLVFMQYNRDAQGNLSPLPKPSVDTGMGLERVTSILQDVPTNYDIDLFQKVIGAIEKLSGKKYLQSPEITAAFRVVADHLRATSFLIADGVLPSNEGRGYVLRRILRRAVRYGNTKLGFEQAFMAKLVPALAEAMGDAYPEIRAKLSFVQEAVKAEEDKFFETLRRGETLLAEALQKLKKGEKLSGQTAFLLYDSFGFPFDLTEIICREKGFGVDEKVFQAEMEKQRERSRSAQDVDGEKTSSVYGELSKKIPSTKFTGYSAFEGHGKVIALLQEGKEVSSVSSGTFEAVFDESPFYGESGGQAGDKGELVTGATLVATVTDVKKPTPELTVVKGKLADGQSVKVGMTLTQRTPKAVRLKTMANHSATHLLHWALKKVLGSHIKQAGSLVNPDLLRFDFTHFKALTPEEKNEIEKLINEKIAASDALNTKLMTKDAAIASGAVALFGEKYGDEVRVIAIGDGFSTELCGGTHVENTAQIGAFVIVSEGGVAAGVRRIVAYTSMTAIDYLKEKARAFDSIREALKGTSDQDTMQKIERLQTREKELEKKLSGLQAEAAAGIAKDLLAKAQTIGGAKVVHHVLKGASPDAVKTLSERLRDGLPSGIIVLGATDETAGKASIFVQISGDLTKTYNAGKLIQASAPLIDGKGGGKPEQAQAGGTKLSAVGEAVNHILSLLEKA